MLNWHLALVKSKGRKPNSMTKICLLLLLIQFTGYSNAHGQTLTKAEKNFIHSNSKTICKDSVFDNANWKPVITSEDFYEYHKLSKSLLNFILTGKYREY